MSASYIIEVYTYLVPSNGNVQDTTSRLLSPKIKTTGRRQVIWSIRFDT